MHNLRSSNKIGILSFMASARHCLASIVCLAILCILPLPTHAQDFDYFYFVQQWPGSYCNKGKHGSCCYPTTGKPEAAFSIHGLWPQNEDGSYPSNCDGDEFDASLIEDLKPQLQKYWGSLSCPSSDGERFWSHEWSKHGTCSGLGQRAYFQAALDLVKRVDILSALEDAGITDDGSTYSLSSISNALTDAIGQTPGIQCNQGHDHGHDSHNHGGHDSSTHRQVFQIYTCVDKDGSTIIRCPSFPNSSCGSKVTIPEF